MPISYLVDATIALNDIERELRIDFPEGEFETLAGYLLDKFHYIPRVGEKITEDNITYKIVAASRNRIDKVLVKIENIEKNAKKEVSIDEREQTERTRRTKEKRARRPRRIRIHGDTRFE